MSPVKKLTSILVAAALVAPTMASAQRIATPGTFERHEQNLEKADDKRAEARTTERRAENDRNVNDTRVPAAKAGKVNTAAPAVGSPN